MGSTNVKPNVDHLSRSVLVNVVLVVAELVTLAEAEVAGRPVVGTIIPRRLDLIVEPCVSVSSPIASFLVNLQGPEQGHMDQRFVDCKPYFRKLFYMRPRPIGKKYISGILRCLN